MGQPLPELLSLHTRSRIDYSCQDPWTVLFLNVAFRHAVCRSTSFFALSVICFAVLTMETLGKHSLEGLLIFSVCVHLIINHRTILQENCKGLALDDFCCFCLIMSHGTIFHTL